MRVLLAWKGPTGRSPDGYKQREEIELPVARRDSGGALLAALGYGAVHAIDREVEVYDLGGATVGWSAIPAWTRWSRSRATPAAIERAIARHRHSPATSSPPSR